MTDIGARFEVLVLGIGNLLWADEGFGVRAVEELHRRHLFPPDVLLMDGGTQGLYLVDYVCRARRLLVFDAVDYGDEPGTLKLVRDADVPRFMGVKKMSLHQTGFQEVLSAAQLLGECPEQLLLIGVQPLELDNWGGSLSPVVRDCIEPAIGHAVRQLTEWGIAVGRRPEPLSQGDGLLIHGLDLASYEEPDRVEGAGRRGHRQETGRR
jgi:hydrogenase maturation protease